MWQNGKKKKGSHVKRFFIFLLPELQTWHRGGGGGGFETAFVEIELNELLKSEICFGLRSKMSFWEWVGNGGGGLNL